MYRERERANDIYIYIYIYIYIHIYIYTYALYRISIVSHYIVLFHVMMWDHPGPGRNSARARRAARLWTDDHRYHYHC